MKRGETARRAREALIEAHRAAKEGDERLKKVAVGNLTSAAKRGLDVRSLVHGMTRDLHSVWGTENQGADAAHKYNPQSKVNASVDQAQAELSKALDALKAFNQAMKGWEGHIATAISHAKKL